MTKEQRKKTARRYTDEEKAEIIQYVKRVNQEKGRGGVSAAVRHFGISPITVNSWLSRERETGVAAPLPKNASTVEIYQRLADLHSFIESKRSELKSMEEEYASLKKRIK
ncbi:MAG: helix-turn-helix domain-containing protein [Verrucomicrobiota bacterium]